MKELTKSAIVLLLFFFISQIIGLTFFVSSINIVGNEVVYSGADFFERPNITSWQSSILIIIGIILGTLLLLYIAKKNKIWLWKTWFFIASTLGIYLALSVFVNSTVAILVSIILVYLKLNLNNEFIYNSTEILFYAGLTVFFAPLLDVFFMLILLILISIYDYIAVYKSKHMVKMANFTSKTSIFPGLKYSTRQKTSASSNSKTSAKTLKPIKTSILGGGDIIFPLLYTAVIYNTYIAQPVSAFIFSLIVIICSTLALAALFYLGSKDKFYPAMPFITSGLIASSIIILILAEYKIII